MVSISSAYHKYAACYFEVLCVANDLDCKEGESSGLAIIDPNLMQIQNALNWALKNLEQDEQAALFCLQYGVGLDLLRNRFPSQYRIDWLSTTLHHSMNGANIQMVIKTLLHLGIAIYESGDPRIALSNYFEALRLAQEHTQNALASPILGYIGQCYRAIGAPDQSLKYFQLAFVFAKNHGDLQHQITALYDLGGFFMEQGEVGSARECFEIIEKSIDEIRDQANRANLYSVFAQIEKTDGNYSSAFNYSLKALEIYRKLGIRSGEAYILMFLAWIEAEKGDWESAHQKCEQASCLYKEESDLNGMITTMQFMTWMHLQKSEPSKALEYIDQTLRLNHGTYPKLTYLDHINAGAAHSQLGQHRNAIRHYREALILGRHVLSKAKTSDAYLRIMRMPFGRSLSDHFYILVSKLWAWWNFRKKFPVNLDNTMKLIRPLLEQ